MLKGLNVCCLCLFCVAGCFTPYNLPIRVETNKTAEVIEVNDALNIVTMGAPYTYLEKPNVDWAQARVDASDMCRKRTGKSGAEPAGPTRRTCLQVVGSDCVRHAIVGDYRCTQNGEADSDNSEQAEAD